MAPCHNASGPLKKNLLALKALRSSLCVLDSWLNEIRDQWFIPDHPSLKCHVQPTQLTAIRPTHPTALATFSPLEVAQMGRVSDDGPRPVAVQRRSLQCSKALKIRCPLDQLRNARHRYHIHSMAMPGMLCPSSTNKKPCLWHRLTVCIFESMISTRTANGKKLQSHISARNVLCSYVLDTVCPESTCG